jgi:peptide/nickel transport system permease protein
MIKYTIKRLITLIPVFIGVSFIVFFIVSLAPGDPARAIAGADTNIETIERIREEYGFNDNVFLRYGRYMWDALHGNLGTSYYSDLTVIQAFFDRLPNTLLLAICSVIIGIIISLPVGIISAVKQYSIFDNIGMVLALLGVSVPSFWLGILAILLFSLKLGILPSGGNEYWYSFILPALTNGIQMMALITRMTRSSMLEVIRQDYITTARSKGLSEKVVILKHALRNALIPIITTAGNFLIMMIGGAVITETIFSWPGVGRLIVDSIVKRDLNMVVGCVILVTLIVSIINLLVDLIYVAVDPQIRTSYGIKTKKVKLWAVK